MENDGISNVFLNVFIGLVLGFSFWWLSLKIVFPTSNFFEWVNLSAYTNIFQDIGKILLFIASVGICGSYITVMIRIIPSYNYDRKEYEELQKDFEKASLIIGAIIFVAMLLAHFLAKWLINEKDWWIFFAYIVYLIVFVIPYMLIINYLSNEGTNSF